MVREDVKNGETGNFKLALKDKYTLIWGMVSTSSWAVEEPHLRQLLKKIYTYMKKMKNTIFSIFKNCPLWIKYCGFYTFYNTVCFIKPYRNPVHKCTGSR